MTASDVVSAVLLLVGGTLYVFAGVGLLRFPDVYARMHAATKPATLGLLFVLAGTAVRIETADGYVKLALAGALQVLTAPVGSHLLGRAAYLAGVPMAEPVFDDLAGIEDDLEGRGPSHPA